MVMLILKKQYSKSYASLYLLGLMDKTSQYYQKKAAIVSNLGMRKFQPRDTVTDLHLCPDVYFPFRMICI